METNIHIPEEIQNLITGYLTGSISSSELIQLKKWVHSSPDHKNAFDRCKVLWMLAGKPEKISTDPDLLWHRIENEIESEKDDNQKTLQLRRLSFTWLRNAVALLFVVGLSSLITWWYTKPGDIQPKITEYVVPSGSKSTVTLPDGTVVWLNAASKLSYNTEYDTKDRIVYLSGEAHFDVVTNKKKPFQVHTSDIIVRALGTKFNVKAYPDERMITTTLEEGIIDVQIINGDQKHENKQIKIKPRERLVYFKQGNDESEMPPPLYPVTSETRIKQIEKNVRLISNVNTELFTSWKSDKWIIEGLTFKCLVPMLERRYNVKIRLSNDGAEQYKFSGILHNESVEQILDILHYTAPVKYEINKDSIYIYTDPFAKKKFERIITTRTD